MVSVRPVKPATRAVRKDTTTRQIIRLNSNVVMLHTCIYQRKKQGRFLWVQTGYRFELCRIRACQILGKPLGFFAKSFAERLLMPTLSDVVDLSAYPLHDHALLERCRVTEGIFQRLFPSISQRPALWVLVHSCSVLQYAQSLMEAIA